MLGSAYLLGTFPWAIMLPTATSLILIPAGPDRWGQRGRDFAGRRSVSAFGLRLPKLANRSCAGSFRAAGRRLGGLVKLTRTAARRWKTCSALSAKGGRRAHLYFAELGPAIPI